MKSVRLHAVTVSIPWQETPSQDLLIASGGTTISGWPLRIANAQDLATKTPSSGMFLLARDQGRHRLAAFLGWKTFWSKLSYQNGRLVITSDGEGRVIDPGTMVALETVLFRDGENWQDLLFDYADEIARRLDIRLKPRPPFIGWSTWDYYGRNWTIEDVIGNMNEVRRVAPESNLLQIDGGWWPARGDYTLLRESLHPDGLKRLASEIRRAGLTAGLHFDGMRGDLASTVAKEHPDYFLKDNHGRIISEHQFNHGDGLNHTFFDFSNPAVIDYMRNVTRNMRENWGFDYYKIDFIISGLLANIRDRLFKDEPDREVVPFNPRLTSVERLHLALRAWREGAGDDAYLLACTAPLGIVLGHVDGLRTGPDISPNFDSARICAEATAANFYLHGRVAWNDADSQVARDSRDEDDRVASSEPKHGKLTLDQARSWAHYVGLFGGPILNSDNLPIMRDERKALFKEAVDLPHCDRFVPLDFWRRARDEKDAFHVILGQANDGLYLAFFNWSDEQRTYRVNGLPQTVNALSIRGGTAEMQSSGPRLTVTLGANRSFILQIPGRPAFDETRRTLVVED